MTELHQSDLFLTLWVGQLAAWQYRVFNKSNYTFKN
jgi:hypothetical protein